MVTLPKDLLTSNETDGNDVSQQHIDYRAHEHQVTLINRVFNGVDTVLEYLFQFPQEEDDTYGIRKERATLRNFVKRAVQAFTGMIFRKPMEVTGYGPKTTKLFDRIDTKKSLKDFTKDIATSATKDGVTYILADAPASGQGGKPYLIHIERSQLINWRKDEFGKFTMIVIEEIVAVPKGLFGTQYVKQYRVYDKVGDISIYRADIDNPDKTKRKGQMGAGFYLHESITTGFTEIPIEAVEVDQTPILYDIAKMNIKHFNRQSHKDRYLTMAALPIPVIWGADVDEEGNAASAKPALVIGVDQAFMFSSTQDCDFQWRELSGDSVELLEADLNSITEDITTGILRAAETANAVQKTATEVQLLQAEASNRVSSIATAVETGMKGALERLSTINKETVPEGATFIINKDFNAALMGSDGARVIMESYLTGLISMQTYLQTMSDMELINIDSAQDEINRIEKDNFKPKPKGIDIEGQDNRTASATEGEGDGKKDDKKTSDKED